MEFIKGARHVTQNYTVVDGPVVETDPNRLSTRRFKVETLIISWQDGNVHRVFTRGRSVLADGRRGKLYHDRSFFSSDLPEWMDEILDITL